MTGSRDIHEAAGDAGIGRRNGADPFTMTSVSAAVDSSALEVTSSESETASSDVVSSVDACPDVTSPDVMSPDGTSSGADASWLGWPAPAGSPSLTRGSDVSGMAAEKGSTTGAGVAAGGVCIGSWGVAGAAVSNGDGVADSNGDGASGCGGAGVS